MKIIWFAARHIADGRLPHLSVGGHPAYSWYVQWYTPRHTLHDRCPWYSYRDIPF